MLKGNIYVTNDMSIATQLSANHLIVCISGDTQNYKEFINATNDSVASLLLPPYEAVQREMDGDMNGFMHIYFAHLGSPDCTAFIAILLRALFNGKNILIYLTKDESKLNYIDYFNKFLTDIYGLTMGIVGVNDCVFDIAKAPLVLGTMLLNDVLTSEEYLASMPGPIPPYQSEVIVAKLMADLRPYGIVSLPDAFKYFNEHIEDKLKLTTELIIPFRSVGP